MSAIQSSVGLVSGIPIQDTVDQLIAISARPRNLLASRNDAISAERAAVDALAGLTVGLKGPLSRLRVSSTFNARTATSSNEQAVGVTIASGASPIAGNYEVTPIQRASAHQVLSQSFTDIEDVIGSGSLKFQFGGFVDTAVSLDDLNGGLGFKSGQIKITDQAGQTAIIDLRAAQSVDDVLDAINNSLEIDVEASVEGDRFVLTDQTGGSGAFRVRDVAGGTTAESLGLDSLTESSGVFTGRDVYTLGVASSLSSLNDGLGVDITGAGVDDLEVTLSDGTSAFVDLAGATTLGDVVDAINNASGLNGDLVASINAEGDGLVLTDNAGGADNLIVEEVAGGSTAQDLGIATGESGVASPLEGARLISGLKDTLVSGLNGGQPLALGEIIITDSVNPAATVDLSGAETLEEIIDTINASAADVTASINSRRDGIQITDDAGGALTITNGVSGTTAEDLGIVTSGGASIEGGSLNRQTVREGTLLSSLNGGNGVDLADFTITDSGGRVLAVSLNDVGSEAQTIGDVIELINSKNNENSENPETNDAPRIVASLNATGNGILLTDTGGGSGTLTVTEVNGNAARDLNLLGASTSTDESGQQVIDGAASYSIDLSDLTASSDSVSLDSLNDGAGVDLGFLKITQADGASFFVNLGASGAQATTVGDVIDLINEASGNNGSITASVNAAGTGILLEDSSEGNGELTVEDVEGSGTAATDLNLIRNSTDTDPKRLDGNGLFTSENSAQQVLQAAVDRINDLDAGVQAAVVNDNGGFRLSIGATNPGRSSELLIDGSGTGFTFFETNPPTDAVAVIGSSGGVGGFSVTSETNDFSGVVNGLTFTLNEASDESVSINVSVDDDPLFDSINGFVDAYNSLRTNIDTVTEFDPEAFTTGILFGRNEVLQVDTGLSRILSGSFSVSGSLTNLESIGLSLDRDGKLSLDTDRLTEALGDDRAAVEGLFSDDENGLVARLEDEIDRLAGDQNSLLSSRSESLTGTIDDNRDRISLLDERLELERERLLLDFFRLEETIALLQSNNTAIESIQPIQIQTRRS